MLQVWLSRSDSDNFQRTILNWPLMCPDSPHSPTVFCHSGLITDQFYWWEHMAGYKLPSSSFDSAEKQYNFLSPWVNLWTPGKQSYETSFYEPGKEGSRLQFNKLPKLTKALLRWMMRPIFASLLWIMFWIIAPFNYKKLKGRGNSGLGREQKASSETERSFKKIVWDHIV